MRGARSPPIRTWPSRGSGSATAWRGWGTEEALDAGAASHGARPGERLCPLLRRHAGPDADGPARGGARALSAGRGARSASRLRLARRSAGRTSSWASRPKRDGVSRRRLRSSARRRAARPRGSRATSASACGEAASSSRPAPRACEGSRRSSAPTACTATPFAASASARSVERRSNRATPPRRRPPSPRPSRTCADVRARWAADTCSSRPSPGSRGPADERLARGRARALRTPRGPRLLDDVGLHRRRDAAGAVARRRGSVGKPAEAVAICSTARVAAGSQEAERARAGPGSR